MFKAIVAAYRGPSRKSLVASLAQKTDDLNSTCNTLRKVQSDLDEAKKENEALVHQLNDMGRVLGVSRKQRTDSHNELSLVREWLNRLAEDIKIISKDGNKVIGIDNACISKASDLLDALPDKAD